jgi:hypothetical protein
MARQPLQDQRLPAKQKSMIQSFPPPVGGWNTRDSLPNMPITDAVVAQNVLCQPAQVVTRDGSANWVTGFANAVNTLMPYNSSTPASMKIFGASGTGIYDVTSSGAVGAAVVSGLTNSWWQWVNFATSAGQFLIAVNGSDSMQTYSNGTWTATATLPITGGGNLSLNTVVNVGIYESTLYFVPANTLGFYYQNAQSIFGTVSYFNLAALCTRGGYLMAVATWTVDGGNGPQDYFVAITSEGEFVVYQGLAFSIAIGTSGYMQLVGVYYIGRPVGRRCFMKFGGDLLILTERGIFPLSSGLQSATIDKRVAITDKIEPSYVELVSDTFSTKGWQIENCQYGQFLIVNVPTSPPQQLVMQYQTRGWSNWTGWNANCFLYFEGVLYYGGATAVYQSFTGESDVGANIVAAIMPAFTQFKMSGQQKHPKLIRPYFEADGNFGYSLTAATDYSIPTTLNPAQSVATNFGVWDQSLWDVAQWGGNSIQTKQWGTIASWPCVAFSPYFSIATNSAQVGLTAYDVLMEYGGVL